MPAKATLTAKPALWHEISRLLVNLVDEAMFEIGPGGLHVSTVDPSHVALVVLDISPSAFDVFDAPAESRIGVDIDKVKAMVRAAGDMSITFRELPGKNGTPQIELSIPDHVWTSNAIDTSGFNEPRIPDLKLPVRCQVPLSFFQDAIRLGECISDAVTMTHDRGWLSLYFKGDHESSESRIGTEAEGVAKSLFPLDYFINFFRSLDEEGMVEVQLGKDYPMFVSGETRSGVRFRYYLAPKMTMRA